MVRNVLRFQEFIVSSSLFPVPRKDQKGIKYSTHAIRRLIPTNCRNVFAPYQTLSRVLPAANTAKQTETKNAKPTRYRKWIIFSSPDLCRSRPLRPNSSGDPRPL